MSDHSSVSDVTWVTDPPISGIHPNDISREADRFIEIVSGWGTVGDGTAWGARADGHAGGAVFIAGLIKKYDDGSRPCFVYRYGGIPMALMQLQVRSSIHPDALEIKNLCTHPATQYGGGMMVEFAFDLIGIYAARGLEFEPDLLVLESYNGASTAAWAALGFTPMTGSNMQLRPAQSDKWTKSDGKWRLAALVGQRYAAG